MAPLSAASLLVAAIPFGALAQEQRKLFGVARGNGEAAAAAAALPINEYPRHYCKSFEVTGLPLTTRVILKSKDTADVEAKVEGFTLSCMDQRFKYRGNDGLMMMEKSKDQHGKDVNCIQTQFESMDVDFSDLTIKYNHTLDALNLASSSMGTVYLEPKEICKTMKFGSKEDLDLDDDEVLEPLRRRLRQKIAADTGGALKDASDRAGAANADVIV